MRLLRILHELAVVAGLAVVVDAQSGLVFTAKHVFVLAESHRLIGAGSILAAHNLITLWNLLVSEVAQTE